jgi:hypothetical protein
MTPRVLALLAATSAGLASGPAEQTFTVTVDSSKAPEAAPHGERAKALCEQWYIRINDALFGPGAPLKHRQIRITIEPGGPKDQFIATSSLGNIRLYAEWCARNPKDFETVVIHELVHVNNDNYALHIARCDGIRKLPCLWKIHIARYNRGMDWVGESINDYVTFTVFRNILEPRLRLDQDGRLYGYDDSIPHFAGLQEHRAVIGSEGYRHSYSVGAAFLLWLERTKHKGLVQELNRELCRLKASPALFKRLCGAPLDKLWSEFVAASRR